MSRWNITENIIAEIRNQISSAMALSWNVEDIHKAVLGITQYELVPAPLPQKSGIKSVLPWPFLEMSRTFIRLY